MLRLHLLVLPLLLMLMTMPLHTHVGLRWTYVDLWGVQAVVVSSSLVTLAGLALVSKQH